MVWTNKSATDAVNREAKMCGIYSEKKADWNVRCYQGNGGSIDTVRVRFGDFDAQGDIDAILLAISEANSVAELHDICEERGLLLPG